MMKNSKHKDVVNLTSGSKKIGHAFIVDRGEVLRKYQYSGLSDKAVPVRGLVFPKSTQEISDILSNANKLGLPVYPVSRGKNWGYGSATPITEGCIVMDLSKMTSIVDLDVKMAMVEVEPGVTQGQLCSALEGTKIMMDVTGAGADTSLMGNILERGFGHTPLGFRSQNFIISEMVLADGTIVDLTNNQSVARYGRVGLASGLHELLQQSNFAVITKMRIMLMHRPEVSLKFIFTLNDNSKLSAYINAMRQLKEESVFDGLPHIGNDMRIISLIRQFDFENWDTESGITEVELSKLRKQYKVARWTLVCGIYGSKEIAKAKANRARKVLSKIGKVRILTNKMINQGNFFLGLIINCFPAFLNKQFLDNLQIMEDQSELMKLFDGYPTNYARKGCYWRNRNKQWQKETDPVADGCGFRWVAPTLPLSGGDVDTLIEIAQRHYRRMGFEFAITLTAINAKLCQAILSIYFDMENTDEINRAKELATRLKKDFDAHGWMSYRIAIDESDAEMSSNNTEIINLRRRLKQAFDPKGIIAPGRYSAKGINNSDKALQNSLAFKN